MPHNIIKPILHLTICSPMLDHYMVSTNPLCFTDHIQFSPPPLFRVQVISLVPVSKIKPFFHWSSRKLFSWLTRECLREQSVICHSFLMAQLFLSIFSILCAIEEIFSSLHIPILHIISCTQDMLFHVTQEICVGS